MQGGAFNVEKYTTLAYTYSGTVFASFQALLKFTILKRCSYCNLKTLGKYFYLY